MVSFVSVSKWSMQLSANVCPKTNQWGKAQNSRDKMHRKKYTPKYKKALGVELLVSSSVLRRLMQDRRIDVSLRPV